MQRRIGILFVIVLATALLSACGPSQSGQAAQVTRIASEVVATQTAPSPAQPVAQAALTPAASQKAGTIRPGTWSATAEFGGFTFTVDPDGQGISEITYNFTAPLMCPDVTIRGTMQSRSDPPWSLSDGQLAIDSSLGFANSGGIPKQVSIKLAGSFDPSGERASGTWETAVNSVPCFARSNNWVASFGGTAPSQPEAAPTSGAAQALPPTSTPAPELLSLKASPTLPVPGCEQNTAGAGNVLCLSSQAGDWLGGGQNFRYGDPDGLKVSLAMNWQVWVETEKGSWLLRFGIPPRDAWRAGLYENATMSSGGDSSPTIAVSGNERGCDAGKSTGKYEILEMEGDLATRKLSKLALNFEFHCDGKGPALRGQIRYAAP